MPFVDDMSRMTHTFFLQSKSQALESFRKFLTTAERQTGLKLKQISTDGGGELTSRDWSEFCQNQGIKHQITVPYSSKMNGVAENKHQVLQYQARTMLLFAGLPISYWAEVVDTATYLINRLPSSKLMGKTPYELWTGYKPSIEHIQVFGSPSYAFIPDHKRKKFDPRSKKLILVGYADELKSYKLFNPKTRTASYAQSVIFHEAALLTSRCSQDPAESGGDQLDNEDLDSKFSATSNLEEELENEEVSFYSTDITDNSPMTNAGSLLVTFVPTVSTMPGVGQITIEQTEHSENGTLFNTVPNPTQVSVGVQESTEFTEATQNGIFDSKPDSLAPLRRSQRPGRSEWQYPPYSPSNYLTNV